MQFTAAGSAMMMDPEEPANAWCMAGCGQCYRLCTTGGTHNGQPSVPGECVVVQLENRCGDGLGEQVRCDKCSHPSDHHNILSPITSAARSWPPGTAPRTPVCVS